MKLLMARVDCCSSSWHSGCLGRLMLHAAKHTLNGVAMGHCTLNKLLHKSDAAPFFDLSSRLLTKILEQPCRFRPKKTILTPEPEMRSFAKSNSAAEYLCSKGRNHDFYSHRSLSTQDASRPWPCLVAPNKPVKNLNNLGQVFPCCPDPGYGQAALRVSHLRLQLRTQVYSRNYRAQSPFGIPWQSHPQFGGGRSVRPGPCWFGACRPTEPRSPGEAPRRLGLNWGRPVGGVSMLGCCQAAETPPS